MSSSTNAPSRDDLEARIDELRRRNRELEEKLAESEETLRAIHSGEVDAILVSKDGREQIFTLRGADEPYRVLFEQMNEGALTVSEDASILYCNRSFARTMRLPLEHVIGSNLESYIRSPEREKLHELFQGSQTTPVRDDITFRTSDGDFIPMQLSISLLPNATLPTYCIIAGELTERRRAEEALKRAKDELEVKVLERTEGLENERRRLEGIIGSLPIGVVITDVSGRTQIMNAAAKRIWGIKDSLPDMPGDIKDLKVRFVDTGRPVAPEDWPIFNAIREGREQPSKVFEIRRKDGSRTTISVTASPLKDKGGRVIAGITLHEDITERYEASRELESTKARLEAIVESIPAAIAIIEPPDGRCTYTNRQMEEVTLESDGMAPILSNGPRLPSYHLDGRPYEVEEYPAIRALRTGQIVLNEVLEFERPDGSRRYANANAVPVKDSRGRVTAVIGIRFDITDQVRSQKNLARSNAELQQFAYIASHDLQEPIRTVMNYLGLLKKKYGGELGDRPREYVDTALEGAERMRELVNDLLQYSRIDVLARPFVQVDLNEAYQEAHKNLSVAIEESGARIEVRPLPKVWGDRTQLVQLMQNLLSNAVKFHRHEDPIITVSSERRGREDVVAISDNGIGIDPSYRDKMFQMFQRLHTKDEYPGTGIGLAISKKIVEKHGGRIWFESEPGKGSTFYFSIPRSQAGKKDYSRRTAEPSVQADARTNGSL